MEDIRFPWKKVLAELKINPEDPAPDKKRIMVYVEKQLVAWLDNRPRAITLDPVLAKELPKFLHTLLKQAGNGLGLQYIAAILAERTGRSVRKEDLFGLAEQIRIYVRGNEKQFYLTGRGSQTLYRLADEKNRATNVVIDAGTAGPDDKDRVFRKYSTTIKDIGLDPSEFLQARSDLDTQHIPVTLHALHDWLEKRTAPAAAPRAEAPAAPAEPPPAPRAKKASVRNGAG